MIQFIAITSLMILLFMAALGNYWFTFGLWPRSWISFFGFMIISMILHAALTKAMKGDE